MRLIIIITLFSLLFVTFFADARLLRFGGRGTISNNSATVVVLVEESAVSGGTLFLNGDDVPGIGEVIMEAGAEFVYSVPDVCFTFLGSQEQLDYFEANNKPCEWLFNEGEDLNIMSFMDNYISSAASHELSWRVFNDDYSRLFEGVDVDISPRSVASRADLSLQTSAPDDLKAGTYKVEAKVLQTAPVGFTFFSFGQVENLIPACFIDGPPGSPEQCIYMGQNLGTSFERTSFATTLNIATVSAPAAVGLSLLFGAAAFGLRRNAKH